MKSRGVVIFDPGGLGGTQNRVFNRKDTGLRRYAWPTCFLYEEARKKGIELITPDIFFGFQEKPKKIIYLKGLCGSSEKAFFKENLSASILTVQENPLYACRFYFNIKKKTSRYDHSFLLNGAKSIVSPKTIFHSSLPPVSYAPSELVVSNFNTRKFLTLINSNSRISPLRKLYVNVRNLLTPLPTFINRELYLDRLEAIRYFSKSPKFDLYGYGWDRPVPHIKSEIYSEAIRRSYRGTVTDKFEVLKRYKFSICFENSIFGGYITEKILDSIFAGCVPVYWGAPDITSYIPKDVFIDFREFKDYDDLNEYLKAVDEKTYNRFIESARAFIHSELYFQFSQEKYAQDFIKVFEEYF